MRILWITNTIFPAPAKEFGLNYPGVGGWMISLANQLIPMSGIKLSIATVYRGTVIKSCEISNVKYYLLPIRSKLKYQKDLEALWKKVCKEFRPEIIHIHGTEFTHGQACMNACPGLNYVISLQGLIGLYAKHYFAGINTVDILTNITIRDIIRGTLFNDKAELEKRSKFEIEYLRKSKHIIGRTNWDLAYSKFLNPEITYHYCNESLRDSFYISEGWNIKKKNDHTIFVSQAWYPIKGLHQVIKAVAVLKKEFPDIQLRIAGGNITKNKSISEKLRLTGYGSYILRLIKKNKLDNHIVFTGRLNEEQMVKEYVNSHVFICPSSIENSPNSLGEAQILGVPSIATYVGGIPDMIVNGESGLLYSFTEYEILAYYVRSIFSNDDLASRLSANGKKHALLRHDRRTNTAKMIKIYEEIVNRDR